MNKTEAEEIIRKQRTYCSYTYGDERQVCTGGETDYPAVVYERALRIVFGIEKGSSLQRFRQPRRNGGLIWKASINITPMPRKIPDEP